jgi:hypothetical protein
MDVKENLGATARKGDAPRAADDADVSLTV